MTETRAAQTQLERAAADFRRLHAERRELVAAWDAAAAAGRDRDAAIAAAAAAFADRKLALRRRKAELDAQARLLEGEAAANRELEARVAHFEKELVRRGAAPAGDAAAGAGHTRGQAQLGRDTFGSALLPERAARKGRAPECAGKPRRPRLPPPPPHCAAQAAQREAHRAESAKLQGLGHEVELLRAALGKAAGELSAQGTANESARAALETKRRRLEALRGRQAALAEALARETGNLGSLEARVAELEGVRRSEEARLKGLRKEVGPAQRSARRSMPRCHRMPARSAIPVACASWSSRLLPRRTPPCWRPELAPSTPTAAAACRWRA